MTDEAKPRYRCMTGQRDISCNGNSGCRSMLEQVSLHHPLCRVCTERRVLELPNANGMTTLDADAPSAEGGSSKPSLERVVTTRLIRRGSPAPAENDWASATPSERIAGVWTLTQHCLAWNREGSDELRLQRSVCRVQRSRR